MTDIWVPNRNLLEPREAVVLPRCGMAGYMMLEGVLPDGRRRVIQPWHKNLITDLGLNRLGSGAVMTHAAVTADNTAPAVGDTALVSALASTSTISTTSNGATGSAPYYGYARRTFTFAPPGSNQNISKVGIGWSASGATLWAAMLIKDINGNPTTITWLAAETLLLTYEARVYALASDTEFSMTISDTEHAGTMRGCLVSSSTNGVFPAGGITFTAAGLNVWNGGIGSVTGQPGGTGASIGATANAYSSGSYKSTGVVVVGTGTANLSGGITAISTYTSGLCYQASLSPAIAKTNLQTLTINVETPTWGRA